MQGMYELYPPSGRVTLVTPVATRLAVARAYAISRMGWIREQQSKLRDQARESPRKFVERESHDAADAAKEEAAISGHLLVQIPAAEDSPIQPSTLDQ